MYDAIQINIQLRDMVFYSSKNPAQIVYAGIQM